MRREIQGASSDRDGRSRPQSKNLPIKAHSYALHLWGYFHLAGCIVTSADAALEILQRTFRPIAVPTSLPQVCTMCSPSRSGVYLLVHRSKIVYVGSSSDVEARLYAHRGLNRSGVDHKVFTTALCMRLPERVLGHYEGALIRALRPRYNRNVPKYAGHDNEILDGLGLPQHDDPEKNNSECLLTLHRIRMREKAARDGQNSGAS